MSGARILYPQFRDEQADSRYPFADRATLLSVERKLDIGRDTFIDATLYPIGGSKQAYISAIIVTPSRVTIQIGDPANKNRATTSYNPLSPPENGVLPLQDGYGRPAGMLLSAKLALSRFSGWPVATHTFNAAATEFVATVIIPAREPGVRALTLDGKDIFTGDVWLIGSRGIVIRGEDAQTVRVDVIGEPLFARYICDPRARFQPKSFVRTLTINGVTCGPDDFGNFVFTATGHGATDTVLRIYPQDGVVKIDTVGRKVV
jgi:hypothetical protein